MVVSYIPRQCCSDIVDVIVDSSTVFIISMGVASYIAARATNGTYRMSAVN